MKTKKLRAFLTVISAILLFKICGCVDTSFQTEGDINGRAYDMKGSPLSGSGSSEEHYTISAGYYPASNIHYDGSFQFDYNIKPYNLNLNFRYGNIIYKNVSINYPQVVTNFYQNFNFYTNIPLSLPEFSPDAGEYAMVAFFSSDFFIPGNNFFHYDKNHYFQLFLPDYIESIQGKLVYLQLKYQDKNIIFERFGIKDVNIDQYSKDTIKFTDEETGFAPPEGTITTQILNKGGISNANSEIYFHLPEYENINGLDLSFLYDQGSHTTRVPVIPFLEHNFKVICNYYNPGTFKPGKKWGYVNSGGNLTIETESSPKIISPADNSVNVKNEDVFEVEGSNSDGIYVYYLYNVRSGNLAAELVTEKRSVKLSDFKTIGHTIYDQTAYDWYVEVFPGFNSMNEFLSKPYIYNEKSNGSKITKRYRFATP